MLLDSHKFPVSQFANNTQATKIKIPHPIFCYTDDRYIMMTLQEYQTYCSGRDLTVCHAIFPQYIISQNPSCELALIHNDMNQVLKLCDIEMYNNTDTSEILVRRQIKNIFFIVTAEPNSWTLDCTMERATTTLNLQKTFSIVIPCGCRLFNVRWSLPRMMYEECVNFDTVMKVQSHHNFVFTNLFNDTDINQLTPKLALPSTKISEVGHLGFIDKSRIRANTKFINNIDINTPLTRKNWNEGSEFDSRLDAINTVSMIGMYVGSTLIFIVTTAGIGLLWYCGIFTLCCSCLKSCLCSCKNLFNKRGSYNVNDPQVVSKQHSIELQGTSQTPEFELKTYYTDPNTYNTEITSESQL